jgi:poly-gamma-glutamate synthesis protein (capsule biosynthesis protein)
VFAFLGGVALLFAAGRSIWSHSFQQYGQSGVLLGRVVDLDGHPIAGASIRFLQGTTISDPDGWFRADTSLLPQWLEVQHPGFLRRIKAVVAGDAALIRLSPDDGETVVIHAVGDVMFGRRFFGSKTAQEDIQPQLHPADPVAAHRALLAPIVPLLANADLTVGNFETPLISQPSLDPAEARPARFHPSKDYVFASAPAAARALRESGFDVLGLANNHLYDALEEGLQSTFSSLRVAGFLPGIGVFGAGSTLGEAWRPAYQSHQGQLIAFLGCTTISGHQNPLNYVVSQSQAKGGAAPCEPRALSAAIRSARQRDATVVVMIHGGNEYQRRSTPSVQFFIDTALAAGASAILNHHPHVVGGFHWNGHALVARSLGNFLFDQTIWPTFESYLVVLHLRHGAVVRAMAEPLILSGYRPYAVVGSLADFVARGAAGRESGPLLVENGTMELDVAQRRRQRSWNLRLRGHLQNGTILRAASGVWMNRSKGPGQVQAGRDLLWVGGFEDEAVGVPAGTGVLWNLSAPDKVVDGRAAAEGRLGARLWRSSANRQPAILSPLHRIPVQQGQQLSILGWIRGPAGVQPRLMVGWYSSRRGASQARLERPITLLGPDRWTLVRWDLTVPTHVTALGLNVILDPPGIGRTHLDVDGVRLILWEAPSSTAGLLQDWYRLRGESQLSLRTEYLPGAEPFLPPAESTPLIPWIRLHVATPGLLPARPAADSRAGIAQP